MNYEVGLPARVWARLLGLSEDESGRRVVGRNWKALTDAKLVKTRRVGRQITAEPLLEDGSGEPYTRPKLKGDPYLKVPYDFWLDGHAAELKLPGLALALIACSLADWFPLPFSKGPVWYGIGASTVDEGFASCVKPRSSKAAGRGAKRRFPKPAGRATCAIAYFRLWDPTARSPRAHPQNFCSTPR